MINPQIGSVYEKKLLLSLTWVGEWGEFSNFFSTSGSATETRRESENFKSPLEDPNRSFSKLVRTLEDSNWLAGVSWLLSKSFRMLRFTRPQRHIKFRCLHNCLHLFGLKILCGLYECDLNTEWPENSTKPGLKLGDKKSNRMNKRTEEFHLKIRRLLDRWFSD